MLFEKLEIKNGYLEEGALHNKAGFAIIKKRE